MRSYDDFVTQATGLRGAYPFQTALADDGFPDVLSVETGAGKTAAVVLGWLWRLFCHPDDMVRRSTPRRLVLCEPMRTLVEQAAGKVNQWLAGLRMSDEVAVHVLMGGEEARRGADWRRRPEEPAILLGTLDMLVSRALNRGYAMGRYYWQLDFALLNNDVQWVFDEVQLMGPALLTARQLDGLRRKFGTALPARSTWMSATVDLEGMETVDNPTVRSVLALSEADRSHPELSKRLDATRLVSRLEVDQAPKRRASSIAEAVAATHRPGTLTLVVMNTVSGATQVYEAMTELGASFDVVLLHGRFRPGDRSVALGRALSGIPPEGPGRVVVSTQVVEAGVDISASALVTEVGPWPSVVQRAGRCNRDGKAQGAKLIWVPVDTKAKMAGPYLSSDVAAASERLEALEGCLVTASQLREQGVEVSRPVYQVLRSRDLLQLFDTAPDASGNDIDVSPYIREADDLDFYVGWRGLEGAPPAPGTEVSAAELCPVPLGKQGRDWASRSWQREERPLAWRFDHIDGRWVRVRDTDLRPGLVVLLDASAGGYSPELGWSPGSRVPVVPAVPGRDAGEGAHWTPEEAVGDERRSAGPRPIELERHLEDTKKEAARLVASLGSLDIPSSDLDAAVLAAALHDIGKAHPVFQCSMRKTNPELAPDRFWAKSGTKRPLLHDPPAFRHELASALALLADGGALLKGTAHPELTAYLVAAHHGRARMGVRSIPAMEREGSVLGVREGDSVLVRGSSGDWHEVRLSLAPVKFGRSPDGSMSWSERALGLLTSGELGPFRLALLESIVVLADWKASALAEAAE